jgi:hypothetical protein
MRSTPSRSAIASGNVIQPGFYGKKSAVFHSCVWLSFYAFHIFASAIAFRRFPCKHGAQGARRPGAFIFRTGNSPLINYCLRARPAVALAVGSAACENRFAAVLKFVSITSTASLVVLLKCS